MKKRNRRRSTSRSHPARRTRFETLEQRFVLSATPTLAPIADLTLYEGAPINLALDAIYDLDGPLTYTVECSDPNVNVYIPEGNRSMKISVSAENGAITGDMIFELFEGRVPRVTNQIISLAEDGFYDGTIFHRIIDNFMIQGGDPTGTGSGGSYLGDFDDQFHTELMHTTTGVLSMAKSNDDTNDSQFFITEGPTRYLDFQHSVFGQLVEGEDIREALSGVDTNSSDRPLNTVTMESVEIFEDNENGILVINAPHDYAGSSSVTITVTIHDQAGNEYVQTPINVTIEDDLYGGYEENSNPFFGDLPTMRTLVNTPYSIDLSPYVQDVEGIDAFEQPGEGEDVDYERRTFFRDAYGIYSEVERDAYGDIVYRDAYGNVVSQELGSPSHEFVPYLEETNLSYDVDPYTGVATFAPTGDLVGTYPFPVATGPGYAYGALDKQVAALNIVPDDAPDASIEMTLVTTPTTVDDQGEVDSLPASNEWVHAWNECSIEVWAKIDDPGQFGIYSVETDLSFDAEKYQVADIDWGVGFNQEQTGTIDNANGTVTGLGGTTKWYSVIPYHETIGYAQGDEYAYPSSGAEDLIMWGDDQYVLVARVNFEPVITNEEMQVQPGVGYNTPANASFALSQGEVKWNAVDGTDVTLGGAVDTDIWPVPFDLDGSGKIDMSDVTRFVSVFKLDINATDWGHVCDFNRDGEVNMSDVTEMVARFQFSAYGGSSLTLPAIEDNQVETMTTILYDNDLLGDGASLATFSRAIATKDGYGDTVAAGERRYDRTRGMCELLSPTLEFESTSYLYTNGGRDANGLPLAVVFESSTHRLRIFRSDWDTEIHNKVYNSGAGSTLDLMDGSVSGLRFAPKSFLVCEGLILAACNRYDISTSKVVGTALLQTIDYGTTWSIIEDASGNQSLPDIDAGHSRLAGFSLQNWMPCVRDGVAVAYSGVLGDYMLQPAIGGGQCGLWLATANESGAPVMKKLRLGFTLPAGTRHHIHTGGMQFIPLSNGKVRCAYIVSIGDSPSHNRIALMWIDCESDFSDWETATLHVNHEYHGSDTDLSGIISGYQFTSCCVGPEDGTLLITADINAGYIHQLTLPTESDDWSTAKAYIERVGPYANKYESSTDLGGVENFAIVCRDPVARTDFVSVWNHKFLTTPIKVGAYSPDGVTWSECFAPYGEQTPYAFWFGDSIVQPTNGVGCYSWPKPVDWVECRPLLLGQGTDNKVGVSSQWVASDADSSVEVLSPNEDGTYTIPSGLRSGETINALGDTEVWHITSTGGRKAASRYLNPAAVMDTEITTGCYAVAVLPLDGNGMYVSVDVAAAASITTQSYSIGRWNIFTFSGDVSNSGGKPRVQLRCAYGDDTVPTDCLVQIISVHQDIDGGIGYPPLAYPNADASIHELEQIEDITVGSRWSACMHAMLPEMGWKAYPRPLLTTVDGNGDWVKVAWTADKTVTCTVSVGGVETSSTIDTLYLFQWAKETQLRLAVSKTGDSETVLQISCGGQAIAETSVAAAISDTTLTLNLAANEDQTVVAPLTVFGVRVGSPEDVLSSLTGIIQSENDPDVDTIEVAAATAQLVTDQASVAAASSQFYGEMLQTINTDAAQLTATRAGYIDALATPADFKADVSSLATAAALTTVDDLIDAIEAKTDTSPAAQSASLMGTLTASDLASLSGEDHKDNDKDEVSAVDLLMALYADAE